MTKPSIGFAKLSEVKPDTDNAPQPTDRDIDAVADAAGFPSRESTRKVVKRPAASEPTSNLSMRPKLSTYNRFVKFSIENRYSYPEALEELMKSS